MTYCELGETVLGIVGAVGIGFVFWGLLVYLSKVFTPLPSRDHEA